MELYYCACFRHVYLRFSMEIQFELIHSSYCTSLKGILTTMYITTFHFENDVISYYGFFRLMETY